MSQTLSNSFSAWQAQAVNPSALAIVTLNNSPISGRLTKYPTITRDMTDIVGATLTVDLENASQLQNNILNDRLLLQKPAVMEYGYTNKIFFDGEVKWLDGSGNYLLDGGSTTRLQLFGGTLTEVNYSENEASLTFADKFTKLSDKIIGSDASPVSFTGSNYNPADLWWYLATSYGGLSTVASTNNTDIDYAAWQGWRAGFDSDTIVVQGYFTGTKILDAFDSLSKLTDSAIYDTGDARLTCARWTGAMSYLLTMSDSYFLNGMSATLTMAEVVNKVNVSIGYNVSSNAWAGQITSANTTSVNSYGELPLNYDDTSIWYVNSVSAVNFAQRIVFRRKAPLLKLKAKTPLTFLQATVGDNVNLTSRVYSLSAHNFIVRGYEIDLEARTMLFNLDEGFGRGAGTLQGLTLDDATYGLLDQTYNALF